MEVGVLGETCTTSDGAPVDLGTRKQRAIIAALALSTGRPVSYDALVHLLWGDHPPDGLPGTLHVYIAGLRKALEPDRPPRAPATVLVTAGGGYALRVPADQVDAGRFDRTVREVHRRLGRAGVSAVPTLPADELTELRDRLDAALALWRGVPYVDLDDSDGVVAERARLEELHLLAVEDHAAIGLGLGEHARVAGELEALTATHPLRERLWALRALALFRAGRQAEALDALGEVRRVLDEELGLDPSPELQDLQTALLRQDPELSWRPAEAPEPTVASAGTAAGPETAVPALPPWPLVGRDEELATLTARLAEAEAGTPTYAVLTGDPGIGKTRLTAELMSRAAERGARVLLGRCSQDDGAPPLWPWQQVLSGLGEDLPETEVDDEGAEFRTWEAIVASVVAAARSGPLVIVLDDLHWADPPSLRVLRLLAASVETGRLLTLVTWRSHPEPTGPLADAAEALGRRHATRLALTGLDSDQTAAVVGAVTHVEPTRSQAVELARRTDGNPFFLVEYARLARDVDTLDVLMGEAHPPTAVNDVLLRRLDRLPEETRSLLRWAAVIGREFPLEVLTTAAELSEDDALDRLDPALEAGLVREEGVGAYLFAHALVRDAVYGGFGPTRQARGHARVAAAFARRPDRESECARHWLAAGPAHAAQAWRAAISAAAAARRVHAYEQAAELLESALVALDVDPAGRPADRYDLLMELADAQRWRGDWQPLLATIERAIAVADEMGDLRLLGRAASSMTIGALWTSAGVGEVHAGVVDALRRCLDGLPATDDELRCRVMLSLANELYYSAHFEERRALTEEALAMARRLTDPALLVDACQVGFVALWCPATAEQRLALVSEAMELADALGNERAFTVASTLTAVVLAELGRVREMWETAALARDYAERLRLPYGLLVLETLELPWLAMAGRFEEAEAQLAAVVALAEQMELNQVQVALAGAQLVLRMWQGRGDEVMPVVLGLVDGPLPLDAVVCMFLLRMGRVDEARTFYAEHGVEFGPVTWFSMLYWAAAAETAFGLHEPELAAQAYERLAPYAGHSAGAGSGTASGPVDSFLALAAAASGETDLARRHADDAARLIEEWGLPLAGRWLAGHREEGGF